jgi:hypothetical protein
MDKIKIDEIELLKKKQAQLNKSKQQKQKKHSRFRDRLKNLAKSPEEIKKWEKETKQVVAPVPMPVPGQTLNLFSKCDDDDSAAMPNTIARSALFAPIARGRRAYVKDEIIASRKDVKIIFSGLQLDIGDADVFMQAVRLADQKKLGTEFQILPYQFLSELGRGGKAKPGKKDLIWLKKAFKRLKNGNITIETNRFEVMLSLIDEYVFDKDTGNHYLRFNPKILALFRKEQYALIDWEKRKKIEVNLSKWLQTYVASNKKGKQKISVEKLKTWCGKEGMRIDKFKTVLKKALKELEKLKIIKDSNINKKDIVTYIRL